MVERNPKVGYYAVYLVHSVISHEIGEEAEVAVYKCKSRVIDAVGIRIHVLVEAIQPSICPKVLHYGS